MEKLNNILEKYERSPKFLIPVLQEIQKEFNYLPEEAIDAVSDKLGVPLNQVFSVATFYNAFSLDPKGKFVIQVCMGTACHVRSAPKIVTELERLLNIKKGETSPDNLFTLETVNCLGACALGPVLTINGKYFGHLEVNKIETILREYQ